MRAMEPFVLASERVRLSVPTARDVDSIAAICTDPAIAEWTTVPSPYSRADAEAFVTGMVVDGWKRETNFTWAVREPGETDAPVLGMVGMTSEREPGVERVGELGYWAAPEARGRGLTTEATRLVVDWALDPEGLGLVRAHWSAFVGNWASRRVAWKVGFRFEGTLRRWGLQRGERRDAWVGSLLPDDLREPVEPWPTEAGAVH
jgi:RimJ/RimL family protein N-acetyltransferase